MFSAGQASYVQAVSALSGGRHIVLGTASLSAVELRHDRFKLAIRLGDDMQEKAKS